MAGHNARKLSHSGLLVTHIACSRNLNGTDTARYTNTQAGCGRFSPAEPTFVGLQSYSNYSFTTAFRNLRVTVL